MENSAISWTTHTFNPWRGCQRVSPGCVHCYAETMSLRNQKVLGEWGPQGTRVIASENQWREPLKWNRKAKEAGERHRVFCASLADVFEDRPELVAPRVRLFHLINETPNLDWLLLTKRPENWSRLCGLGSPPPGGEAVRSWSEYTPRNVWLGVSVEDQQRADERIPLLLQIPAAVRFLSVEPLLGPVDLSPWLEDENAGYCNACSRTDTLLPNGACQHCGDIRTRSGRTALDWVIVGGESGHGARPFDIAWARRLRDQCKYDGVAFFMKQLGSSHQDNGSRFGPYDAEEGAFPRCWRCGHFDFGPCSDGTLLCNGCNAPWDRLKDAKGGDMTEWPQDLRVREFPKPR